MVGMFVLRCDDDGHRIGRSIALRWQETDLVIRRRATAPARIVKRHAMHAPLHDLPGLDFDACERVRYARDASFDGVIFIGVPSTRIYCRPVCPVRHPLSRNVRYFASAAAAEAG